jgi:hypothetical protein
MVKEKWLKTGIKSLESDEELIVSTSYSKLPLYNRPPIIDKINIIDKDCIISWKIADLDRIIKKLKEIVVI